MRNHELLEIAVNNSTDGIAVIDQDYTIRVFNPAMQKITGWSVVDAIGAKCYEVLKLKDSHSSEVCQVGCPFLSDTEASLNFHGMIRTRDGYSVDIGVSYSRSQLYDGQKLLVVNIQDANKLAELEELRTSLLAGISHELQTPISIIKAYASTLARSDAKWDAEIINAKLKTIEEESDRLSAIVTKLLFTSRLEAGAVKLNRMTLDLSKEAKRITKRLAVTTDAQSIVLDFPGQFPPVFADPEKIEEVFTNLLENAIKFSPYGGIILIRGNITQKDVEVSVIDSGIGINPEDSERLFERFYRADDSNVTSTKGTGLGLYICRLIVESHGGKISAQNNQGPGACFTFSFPMVSEQRELKE